MKTNSKYWNEVLERYRVSKTIRRLREKFNISFKDLSEITGYSRQYIYGIQEITIKPSEDFKHILGAIEIWIREQKN